VPEAFPVVLVALIDNRMGGYHQHQDGCRIKATVKNAMKKTA